MTHVFFYSLDHQDQSCPVPAYTKTNPAAVVSD